MKRTLVLTSIALVLALTLAACGGAAPTPTPAAVAGGALSIDYTDATSVRNQLALGIMRLEKSADALTTAQAKQLLPLWQAIKTLTASSTTATAEVEAVQNQIIAALTSQQTAAIAAMRLTNADLQTYYVEIGVAAATTPEAGVTPQSGSMKSLPQEQREAARATAQAAGTPVSGGAGSSKASVLTDNVIALLSSK